MFHANLCVEKLLSRKLNFAELVIVIGENIFALLLKLPLTFVLFVHEYVQLLVGVFCNFWFLFIKFFDAHNGIVQGFGLSFWESFACFELSNTQRIAFTCTSRRVFEVIEFKFKHISNS